MHGRANTGRGPVNVSCRSRVAVLGLSPELLDLLVLGFGQLAGKLTLGHLVARTDMCAALTVLADRLREPRAADPATWLPDSGNTGPVRLPIAFTPAPRPAPDLTAGR